MITLCEMHFFTSSFDNSKSACHHVIPVIRYTTLWKWTPSENGDDVPLIIEYGVRLSMGQNVGTEYLAQVQNSLPPIPFKHLKPPLKKHIECSYLLL
jgi:hypothetical protein